MLSLLLLGAAPPEAIDRSYEPRPGDRAVLYWYVEKLDRVLPAQAVRGIENWDRWQGILGVEDDALRGKLIEQFYRSRKIVDIAPKTPVMITEIHLYSDLDSRNSPFVVRPLEGPHKGLQFTVAPQTVCRLKAMPTAPEPSRSDQR